MSEWKDVTSYSRGEERVPTAWAMAVGRFRLVVICNHIYHRNKWVMHFAPLFDARDLNLVAPTPVTNLEEAKRAALDLVTDELTTALGDMQNSKP